MNDIVLDCKNISKSFKEADLEVDVLQRINLTICKGEQIAIIGSSGAGKSTLLHLLGGLETPTTGEVWVAGKQISNLNQAQRGLWRNLHLGFVYQFHHLLAEFTALENVCMPLLIRGLSVAEAQDKAVTILSQIGLEKRLKHKPGELSGGERQRTAVARALVTEPSCVLADEPTGNLDQHTAEQVYERILELNNVIGTSLILVTHAPNLAKRMDRTLTLVDGRLVNS
ncbi:MAG TPA: lipoprotein-releasing ABC transporter ATP-binding protein LolD [Thioploca sp.]|nr:lipoprotein-releasing ABC transporter ATP-binding protein LolD [Thioploca sp.]